jgi:hypothetical protein
MKTRQRLNAAFLLRTDKTDELSTALEVDGESVYNYDVIVLILLTEYGELWVDKCKPVYNSVKITRG